MSTLGRKSTLLYAYLEKWAFDTPGKIALIEYESGQQLMYRQLAVRVEQIAVSLLDSGIRMGDRVAVLMPVSVESVSLMYACLRVGAVFTPLPATAPAKELWRWINQVEAKLFCYEFPSNPAENADLTQLLDTHAGQLPTCIERTTGSVHAGSIAWADWLSPGSLRKRFWKNRFTNQLKKADQNLNTGSLAFVFFSETKTGTNQAVAICYENLLRQRKVLDEKIGLNRHSKVLAQSPAGEMYTWIHSILIPLSLGASVVLKQVFDGNTAIEALSRHCISVLIQSAAYYQEMLEAPGFDTYSQHSLKWALLTDTPPRNRWMRRLHRFAEHAAGGWFLPEAGGFVTLADKIPPVEDWAHPVGGISPDQQLITVRGVMDLEGNAGPELPSDHMGEICVHPPSVFAGYVDDSVATREAISREGIYYSGIRGFIRMYKGIAMLYMMDESSEQLKQLQRNWRKNGVIHPVMQISDASATATRIG